MSPIRGLTDRAPAFPRLGVLRKGAPRPQTGNAPGKDLEYFRFTSDDEAMAEGFAHCYGDKPTEINVYLPYATPGENFQAWQEEWVAGGLKHRCDGQTCVRWLNGNGYRDDPRPCPGGCKPVGRLTVIIPELRRMALVTALTTSLWDIITLEENLNAAAILRGDLRGIPFVLRRRPRVISTPSGTNGQRARREKWLLSIEPNQQWVVAQLAASARAALPEGAGPLQLPALAESVDTEDESDDWVDEDGEIHEVPPAADFGDKRADTAHRPDVAEENSIAGPNPDAAQSADEPPDPEIRNFGALWTAVKERYGLTSSEALRELGYARQSDIAKPPAEIWAELKGVMKERLV